MTNSLYLADGNAHDPMIVVVAAVCLECGSDIEAWHLDGIGEPVRFPVKIPAGTLRDGLKRGHCSLCGGQVAVTQRAVTEDPDD